MGRNQLLDPENYCPDLALLLQLSELLFPEVRCFIWQKSMIKQIKGFLATVHFALNKGGNIIYQKFLISFISTYVLIISKAKIDFKEQLLFSEEFLFPI
jgi:hypothetical protein